MGEQWRASHVLGHEATPDVFSCRYREFIADETRRKWEWQCRHEDETAFWTSVVNGIIGRRLCDVAPQSDTLFLRTNVSCCLWKCARSQLSIRLLQPARLLSRTSSCDSVGYSLLPPCEQASLETDW